MTAPKEVWIGIRGVNTHKADQGDVLMIRHDASPEVVATMPGAQALVAAAYQAAAEAFSSWFGGDGGAGFADHIRALTPADAKATLDRLIAEAVAQLREGADHG